MRRLAVLCTFLFVAALTVYGCGKDDKKTNNPGGGTTGNLRVRLTDAPADFDSVILDLREIALHRTADSTWRAFTPSQRLVSVLSLRNGNFLDLGTFSLAGGAVDSMRLKLGTGSYVMSGSTRQPIAMAGSDTNGVAFPATGVTVTNNTTTDIGVDLEVARSLRADGAGGWTFEPQVRVVPFSGTGSITGTISPGDSLAAIYGFAGADTVASSLTGVPSGDFAVTLLAPGTYDLLVYGATNQRDTTVTGVTVTAGQATNLGTIPMLPLAPARASRIRH